MYELDTGSNSYCKMKQSKETYISSFVKHQSVTIANFVMMPTSKWKAPLMVYWLVFTKFELIWR